MKIEINLPDDVELSQSIQEVSEGYINVLLYGKRYYIPVTKDFKKIFRGKRIKDNIKFQSYTFEKAVEDYLRDLICSIYLQIRDTVGDEIHTQLSQELSQGFEKLFENYLSKRINNELENKTKLLDNKG